MSNLTGVTNFFSTANEGFSATLSSGILASATNVPLSNTTGLVDGTVFVGIIEPTGDKQQAFTGLVDLTNSRITSVVWTRGTNVAHGAGALIVDYVTGTDWNMLTSGILKFANQSGKLIPTFLYDANGNKTLALPATASAVNYLSIDNSATAHVPTLEAAGADTVIGLSFLTKGSDLGGNGLYYNGTAFRALAKDWCRIILGWTTPINEQPVGTNSQFGGTGWVFPADTAAWVETSNTQNAEIRYKLYLDAGTYTFINYHRTGTDKGIVSWGLIDELGTVNTIGTGTDLYAASGSAQTTVTATGVTITYGGYYKLWFKTATKNASSTGYILPYFGSQIKRTA